MSSNDAQAVTASAAVSARVSAWLAEQERSQSWLARRLEVTPVWVHRKLTGRSPWLLDDLPGVADVLGVTVAELVATDDADDAPSDLGDRIEASA